MKPIMACTVSTLSSIIIANYHNISRYKWRSYLQAQVVPCCHDAMCLFAYICTKHVQKSKSCDFCGRLPLSDGVWGLFLVQVHPCQHHDWYCNTGSSTSAQSLKPTATDVFQRLHASHAEAGQKAEALVVMNLIVKRERCHAKIHGAPDVEIGVKTSTIRHLR